MSEARYTKGPWVIHESNAIVGEKLDDHPIWLRPVIARFATGVRPADARLMAAAPELLEALQECKAALEWCVEQGGGPVCEHKSGVCFCKENKAINSADDAIAKALGERP